MAQRQENRSVESEYTEYAVEDTAEEEEEQHLDNQKARGPHSLPQHQESTREAEYEEYDFDPFSVIEDEASRGSPAVGAIPKRHMNARNQQHHQQQQQHHSGPNNDMEKILLIQGKRIKMLLEANRAKEERMQALEKELHHQKVQHKEGIYWLQLQLDTARREKDAAEERLAELQADLHQMLQVEKAAQKEGGDDGDVDDDDKAEMNQKLQKCETSLGVMENQMSMIKTSCGEVIKTLKEEIADLMEERSRMEVDLLNQLSTLDSEKKQAELEYDLRLSEKDEIIERMQTKSGVKGASSSEMKLLKQELEKLHEMKECTEELAQKERMEADEVIHWLKEDKARLQRQLEASADDISLLQSELNSKDAIAVLDRVTHERESINESMSRVTAVWELAEASISNLEDAMDQLRPTDDEEVCGDREKMLSTLESASLLHGQIRVSLLLIELKLRNQLECLKNDKLTMGEAAPSDHDVTKTMEEIQKDALTALSQVETALSKQMIQLKETALKEAAETKEELRERVKKLEQIKEEYKRLETEIAQLKDSNQGSDGFVAASSSEGEHSGSKKEENAVLSISNPVMIQLHEEVIRIAERIQEKNKTIASLREELEDHKSRGENLRKELKRSLRANHASQNVSRSAPHTPTKVLSPSSGTKTIPKKITSADRKHLSSPLSLQSPTKTPVKVKDALSARYGAGKSPVSAANSLYTPNSSIKPLQPSPREISRPRHSPTSPWVPGFTGVVNTE